MRFSAIVGMVGLYLVGMASGCATETGSNEDFTRASCEGARLDDAGYCRLANGRFAKSSCCTVTPPVKYACDVVDVNQSLNGSLLEESLGALYDIDEDGYLNVDEDATSGDIQIGADGKSIWLGNYHWSNEDGDEIEEVPRDQIDVSEWLEQPVVEYKVTPGAANDGIYRFRVFPESGVGVVFHEGNGADGALASLDCRDVLSKPAAEPLDENDLSCDIAWFDYDLRDYDGSMGAPMTLDYFDTEYGASEIDESYISVYIDLEETGWDITLGGYSFEEPDNDAITFTKSTEDEELGEQLTWTIAGDGWDDHFEVRIWRNTGLGVVLVDANEDEPAGKLAVIDCRGHDYPDVYSW